MPIKYYPNRVFKKSVPAIDRVMAQKSPVTVRGSADITSTGLNQMITCNSNWQIDSIQITFNNTVTKTYSASLLNGINVVQNMNDFLWITYNNIRQKITLTPGFYTGTGLATELENDLNANTLFSAAGANFTVSYNSATGLFTITPASGTVAYTDSIVKIILPDQNSIAGFLFGFNATTNVAASITSDTPVWGLGDESWIIDEVGVSAPQQYVDDFHVLTMDQALVLTSNTAATRMDYQVVYEVLV
jgi:hypothetical protein